MIVFSIIVAFAIIIIMMKKNYSVGSATIIGGVVLAFLSGIAVPDILVIIKKVSLDKGTLDLVLSIVLISILGNAMQSYGVMDSLVHYLGTTFKSTKHLLFVIPSIIAAFTAPGSAIVAAPVIEGIGSRIGLANSKKAAINLYIRHVWYFIVPISFPIIYAAHLAGISLWTLIKIQFHLAVIGLMAGYLVYIRPIPKEAQSAKTSFRDIRKVLYFSSPIGISVLLLVWLPFNIALLAGWLVSYLIRTKEGSFKDIIINKQNWDMAYATLGTMIFKGVIDSIPAIKQMITVVIHAGIPLELVIIITSIALGAILANRIALVAILYPIFLPLVHSEQYLATVVLIYGLGFLGYFVSPIHLCQVLTNQYFCVKTDDLYKEYRITIPVLLVSILITYWLLKTGVLL